MVHNSHQMYVKNFYIHLMRIMYHWQGTCVKKWEILGVHFYIHGVQFMCGQIHQNIYTGHIVLLIPGHRC